MNSGFLRSEAALSPRVVARVINSNHVAYLEPRNWRILNISETTWHIVHKWALSRHNGRDDLCKYRNPYLQGT
jgi:hypothetical protein